MLPLRWPVLQELSEAVPVERTCVVDELCNTLRWILEYTHVNQVGDALWEREEGKEKEGKEKEGKEKGGKEKGGKEKGGKEKREKAKEGKEKEREDERSEGEGRGEWEEWDYILILRRFYEAVPHVGLQWMSDFHCPESSRASCMSAAAARAEDRGIKQ